MGYSVHSAHADTPLQFQGGTGGASGSQASVGPRRQGRRYLGSQGRRRDERRITLPGGHERTHLFLGRGLVRRQEGVGRGC